MMILWTIARARNPLYEIEFPKIIVSYANSGERTRQDVLNRVSFSKFSHKAAQGINH